MQLCETTNNMNAIKQVRPSYTSGTFLNIEISMFSHAVNSTFHISDRVRPQSETLRIVELLCNVYEIVLYLLLVLLHRQCCYRNCQ